jgi:hypothetical protein
MIEDLATFTRWICFLFFVVGSLGGWLMLAMFFVAAHKMNKERKRGQVR